MEQWKPIPNYESYEASTLGRIRQGDRILAAYQERGVGHPRVYMQRNGKKAHYKVCQLIIDTFVPNPYNYETFTIVDGDRTNLIPSNLEWGTTNEILMRQFGLKDFYIKKMGKYFDKEALVKKFMQDIPLREKKIWFFGQDMFGNVPEETFKHNLVIDSLDKIWNGWIDNGQNIRLV